MTSRMIQTSGELMTLDNIMKNILNNELNLYNIHETNHIFRIFSKSTHIFLTSDQEYC